jgi:hypothetical protein
MQLNTEQKRAMYEDGYVRIPNVIPPEMVREALLAINHNLITKGMPPDQLPKFHSQSFCPEIQKAPVISDLFNKTPVKGIVESLLERGKVPDQGGAQIALRWPGYANPPKVGPPHVDGTYSPNNGVAPGTISHFTMLAGVFLSSVPGPFCGNFTVWPGTHRSFADYFRAHGPESLLKGLPPVPMPEPVQVMAEPGDLVLAHYLLAHSVAANVSPNVRYTLFFRVTHADHKQLGNECMTDPWAEWAGMREALPG